MALRAVAAGTAPTRSVLGLDAESCAFARRVLRPQEGTWHDGDDNLVRGHLDRWAPAEGPAHAAQAASLLDAGAAVARMRPRAATLWCFAWHLESALQALAVEDPQAPC